METSTVIIKLIIQLWRVICMDATLEKNLGTLFGYIMVQMSNEDFVNRLEGIKGEFKDEELVSLIDKAISLHEYEVTKFVKFPKAVTLAGYSLSNTMDLVHARVDSTNEVKERIKHYIDYVNKDIKTFYPHFNKAYLAIAFGNNTHKEG